MRPLPNLFSRAVADCPSPGRNTVVSLVFFGVDCHLGIYVFREEFAQGMGIGFLYGHSSHSAVSLLHTYRGLLAA